MTIPTQSIWWLKKVITAFIVWVTHWHHKLIVFPLISYFKERTMWDHNNVNIMNSWSGWHSPLSLYIQTDSYWLHYSHVERTTWIWWLAWWLRDRNENTIKKKKRNSNGEIFPLRKMIIHSQMSKQLWKHQVSYLWHPPILIEYK